MRSRSWALLTWRAAADLVRGNCIAKCTFDCDIYIHIPGGVFYLLRSLIKNREEEDSPRKPLPNWSIPVKPIDSQIHWTELWVHKLIHSPKWIDQQNRWTDFSCTNSLIHQPCELIDLQTHSFTGLETVTNSLIHTLIPHSLFGTREFTNSMSLWCTQVLMTSWHANPWSDRSALQNIVSFVGLFCKRDLSFVFMTSWYTNDLYVSRTRTFATSLYHELLNSLIRQLNDARTRNTNELIDPQIHHSPTCGTHQFTNSLIRKLIDPQTRNTNELIDSNISSIHSQTPCFTNYLMRSWKRIIHVLSNLHTQYRVAKTHRMP